MKQYLQTIKVKDLLNNYIDNGYDGVTSTLNGKQLLIRPAYQREFIYPQAMQERVIDTVRKNCCLSIFQIYCNQELDIYEVADGQQRLLSILHFIAGDGITSGSATIFDSKNGLLSFATLSDDAKDEILNFQLIVNFIEGTHQELIEWFHTINTEGIPLKNQEILNSSYTGEWLTSAKSFFSRRDQGAVYYTKSTQQRCFLKGDPDRQDLLETALSWHADKFDISIEEYMAKHYQDDDANDLINYFQDVMKWITRLFNTKSNYRKEMSTIKWGILYNKFAQKSAQWDPFLVEAEVKRLMQDDDITKKSGIYEYVLSGDFDITGEFIPDKSKERLLSIRSFSESDKRSVYENQNHICPKCGEEKKFDEMQGDHIIPWSKGGHTVLSNLQMLCTNCNRTKTNI